MLPGAQYSKHCVCLEITGSRFIPLCTSVFHNCENPTPEGSIKNLMHYLYEYMKKKQRTMWIFVNSSTWWWVVVGWAKFVASTLLLSVSYWDPTKWHPFRTKQTTTLLSDVYTLVHFKFHNKLQIIFSQHKELISCHFNFHNNFLLGRTQYADHLESPQTQLAWFVSLSH